MPISEKPDAAEREVDFDRVFATVVADANWIARSSQKECRHPADAGIEVGDLSSPIAPSFDTPPS
jgi:hypothetical protein